MKKTVLFILWVPALNRQQVKEKAMALYGAEERGELLLEIATPFGGRARNDRRVSAFTD